MEFELLTRVAAFLAIVSRTAQTVDPCQLAIRACWLADKFKTGSAAWEQMKERIVSEGLEIETPDQLLGVFRKEFPGGLADFDPDGDLGPDGPAGNLDDDEPELADILNGKIGDVVDYAVANPDDLTELVRHETAGEEPFDSAETAGRSRTAGSCGW